MPTQTPDDKAYWFASRYQLAGAFWYRWYPVNVQGMLALIGILGGFCISLSLIFVPMPEPHIIPAALVFTLTQGLCVYVLFWRTKPMDT